MNLSLFTKNSPEKKSSIASPKDNTFRIGEILSQKSQEYVKKKRISKPYQFFGIWIAQNLDDFQNISLYIRLAKYQRRELLEHAVSYVSDYPNAQSKPKLFLWYLKDKLEKLPPKERKKIKHLELIGKPRKINKKTVLPEITELSLESLERFTGKKFEKDKVMGVFRLDFYSEELNCVVEEFKNPVLLSAKSYQISKEKYLSTKKIKYIQIKTPKDFHRI